MNKIIAVCILAFLGGCASGPSYDEMRDEALRTGDWTKVEAHEKRKNFEWVRKAAEDQCMEQEAILVCDNRYKSESRPLQGCGCMSRRELIDQMRQLGL